MAEPLLAQYDGDPERALALFDRYAWVRDPWLRAMGQLYRAMYGSQLGRLDGAEGECLAALAAFREIGETWGTAITLTQLAEFFELRADHAASIAALEEAAAIGRQLGSWGEMSYVEAKLAVFRARTGEVARAHADLDRVEREADDRGGHGDTQWWVSFMRAELAWRAGDLAGVFSSCDAVLAGIEDLRAPWWQSLRAHLGTRQAMAALAQGDLTRCQSLLAQGLAAVEAWVEYPTLAVVLDGAASYVLARGRDGDADLAAALLGAAHAVRGAFDESSLDAPAARAGARDALGEPAFDAAYQRGRDLDYAQALSSLRSALTTD